MRHRIPLALLLAPGVVQRHDSSSRQAIRQVLTVACKVDGVVVPVAQPIVATLGSAGADTANVDLLLHPAVVEACKAASGSRPAPCRPPASDRAAGAVRSPRRGAAKPIPCDPPDPLLDAPFLIC